MQRRYEHDQAELAEQHAKDSAAIAPLLEVLASDQPSKEGKDSKSSKGDKGDKSKKSEKSEKSGQADTDSQTGPGGGTASSKESGPIIAPQPSRAAAPLTGTGAKPRIAQALRLDFAEPDPDEAPTALVGKVIDVEGHGIGQVVAFHKVNFGNSTHEVDFGLDMDALVMAASGLSVSETVISSDGNSATLAPPQPLETPGPPGQQPSRLGSDSPPPYRRDDPAVLLEDTEKDAATNSEDAKEGATDDTLETVDLAVGQEDSVSSFTTTQEPKSEASVTSWLRGDISLLPSPPLSPKANASAPSTSTSTSTQDRRAQLVLRRRRGGLVFNGGLPFQVAVTPKPGMAASTAPRVSATLVDPTAVNASLGAGHVTKEESIPDDNVSPSGTPELRDEAAVKPLPSSISSTLGPVELQELGNSTSKAATQELEAGVVPAEGEAEAEGEGMAEEEVEEEEEMAEEEEEEEETAVSSRGRVPTRRH